MKNQALFSSKDKSKKLKCRLLQFLFGALRVNFMLTKVNQGQKMNIKEFAKPPNLDPPLMFAFFGS